MKTSLFPALAVLAAVAFALAIGLVTSVSPGRGAHTTPAVIATVPVGFSPEGVGVNPTTDRVYVSNVLSATVSVIDGATNTVIATVPVGRLPWAVGVNPTTGRVYVANRLDDTVSVVDGATNAVIATVPVGADPRAVGVNPTTNRVYVANGPTVSA